jgi:type VI protein secretion system component VasF
LPVFDYKEEPNRMNVPVWVWFVALVVLVLVLLLLLGHPVKIG